MFVMIVVPTFIYEITYPYYISNADFLIDAKSFYPWLFVPFFFLFSFLIIDITYHYAKKNMQNNDQKNRILKFKFLLR